MWREYGRPEKTFNSLHRPTSSIHPKSSNENGLMIKEPEGLVLLFPGPLLYKLNIDECCRKEEVRVGRASRSLALDISMNKSETLPPES